MNGMPMGLLGMMGGGNNSQLNNIMQLGALGGLLGGENNEFTSQLGGMVPLAGLLGQQFGMFGKDDDSVEATTAGVPDQNVNIPGVKNKNNKPFGGIMSNLPIGLLGNNLTSFSPLAMLFGKK